MEPILKVENLNLSYQKKSPQVLFDISFSVFKDDFYAIIGPSGAGKYSLIRCINRLADSNSGNIFFNGENIPKLGGRKLRSVRRKIGIIFQEFNFGV